MKPPRNAICLDGGPPLYYHPPGSGDGVDKWQIHMEGDADVLPPDAQAVTGYFNRSLATNPMANWNYIFISRGMQAATNVVVGGCSADGMAVCLNCDHWADQIANVNAKTNVVCHADSGWFLLIPTTLSCPNGCFDGVNFPSSWFNGVWKNGYEGHNASLSMHPACLADRKEDRKTAVY
eukprot:gene10277-14308_t